MSISDHAYIIYNAHYQETGALVKFLTLQHGVVSAIVRGVHQPNKKSNALRAALQLGNLVECQWNGKSSLKTVYQLDLIKSAQFDSTEKFICLSYVHELLLYFLRDDYPVDAVFESYRDFLESMQINKIELALRHFEFNLLESVGYGMDLAYDIEKESQVVTGSWYNIIPGSGVSLVKEKNRQSFLGEHLLAVHQRDFYNQEVYSVAKKITRNLLSYHMDGKPIKARQLYVELFS